MPEDSSTPQVLTLEGLAQYDQGSLAVVVNQALARILHDLRDRPRLGKKARKLTMEFLFRPIHTEGELDEIKMAAKVKTNIPDVECRENTLMHNHQGMVFDPESRHCRSLPGQQSLDLQYSDEEKGE